MGRIWVLDTDTKGTGAEMVPLDKVERKPEPVPPRRFIAPDPGERPEPETQPKPPPRFRVTDAQVLAERAGTRATVDLLRSRRSVVDVTIDVWDHEQEIWRKLTHGERKVLWELRGRRR